jgi:hypothetical protein
MIPRDSQRSAIYKWEREIAQAHPDLRRALTLAECEDMVRLVWKHYGRDGPMPAIKDGRGTRHARGGAQAISLPVWSRQPYIVLHETAHALVPVAPWHGRVFARVFADLLVRFGGVPRAEVFDAGRKQKPRRVWFAEVAACPQPPSRRLRKWQEEHRRLRIDAQAAHRAVMEHLLVRPKG